MKKLISMIIFSCMVLAFSSCSSNRISFDDERLTNIRTLSDGRVVSNQITLHCENAMHSDNFNTIEIIPEIEIDGGIRYVFNETKFLVHSNVNRAVGILSDNGAFEELFSWGADYETSIIYCDDDYIIYTTYKWEDYYIVDNVIEMYVYSLSERNSLKIADIDVVSMWVDHNAVRINDTIYYDIVDYIAEDGYAVYSIMEYNISDQSNKLLCEDACRPSIYNDKLAFIKNSTAIVEYTDEGVSELLNLEQSGLYQTVNELHISGDKICYRYSIKTDEEHPDGVTGSGIGFMKDGKRYNVAEVETAYMCSLSVEGNLAAWNYDSAEGILPIVYDIEKDTAIVLDAERSIYWSLISDNTVYFIDYLDDSKKIKIITYSANEM